MIMKSFKTVNIISTGVVLILMISCGHKNQMPLHLYEGRWMMETPEGVNFEEWDRVSDSLYVGRNYTLKDNDSIIRETISLKYVDGVLCYAPVVQNQNEGREILFPLKEYVDAEKKFVFENLGHDFPQRIIYHFADDNLNARIEGEVEGKMESFEVSYKKQ